MYLHSCQGSQQGRPFLHSLVQVLRLGCSDCCLLIVLLHNQETSPRPAQSPIPYTPPYRKLYPYITISCTSNTARLHPRSTEPAIEVLKNKESSRNLRSMSSETHCLSSARKTPRKPSKAPKHIETNLEKLGLLGHQSRPKSKRKVVEFHSPSVSDKSQCVLFSFAVVLQGRLLLSNGLKV